MSHPTASLDIFQLRAALITWLDHAMPACAHIPYRLVGTAAALLQGVQLPCADIDILVKARQDVDAFGATLNAFECLDAPTFLPGSRQYYSNYNVNGVEIGFSTVEVESDSDVIETMGRGPWEHYVLVPCGSYQIPAVTLELRLITELYRDRPDRYNPLIEYLQDQFGGGDVELITRGMRFAGVSNTIQTEVLGRLAR
jgi:hypothetical protein